MKGRSFLWIAAGVILADQVTKWWVHHWLPLNASVVVLPGLLKLTHVHNSGSAFSLFQGAGGWLVLVSIVSLIAILRYWLGLRRRGETISPALLWGLALPFGGAAGNLIDRLRFGYVEDFLELPRWPVFNVADSAITIGALLLVYHFTRQEAPAGSQGDSPEPERKRPAAAQEESVSARAKDNLPELR
jgi:signal peptidase II